MFLRHIQISEADEIGLMLMAKAGYDPRQANNFFKKMLSERKGGKTPVFLSTHPADDARIQKINLLIPKAMTYYRR
jgi:predicted Zn-dependent protease